MAKFENTLRSKREKTRTYIFNEQTLEAHDEEVRKAVLPDAIYVCNCMYSAAMLLGMRDELGFGAKRLYNVFTRIQENFNAIASGHVNYYDMVEQLKAECHIQLLIEKPDGSVIDTNDIYKAVSGMPVWRIRMK